MALTIGQVANAADVHIETIRYYERRGLFPTPRRTPAGYRQYAEDAVSRLRFIKHAQELGFSLNEIQDLLGLRVRHGAACDTVERKTRQKIEVVQQRFRDLGGSGALHPDPSGLLRGIVRGVRHGPRGATLRVEIGGLELEATAPTGAMPGLGAELPLGLETDRVSVFPGRIDV